MQTHTETTTAMPKNDTTTREMSGEERIARFVAYAMAFEQAWATDDWTPLEDFLTADAEHVVVGGGPLTLHSVGRRAFIDEQRRAVDELDRRFDRRLPEITSGPSERDSIVWMDWRLTLQRDGLPDLVIEGTHGTHFEGDRISRIEEALTNATTERVAAYLESHDTALKPAPSAPAPAPKRISRARMKFLVERYAAAKSRADGDAALAFCHPQFRLETIPFGITSRDRAETAVHLGVFFDAFPDYGVRLDEMAYGDGSLACWGKARMTLKGEGLGLAPTNETAEVPFFCAFTFADDLLASETFCFDLASLCDGIGVPLPLMRQTLEHLRAAQDGVIAGG